MDREVKCVGAEPARAMEACVKYIRISRWSWWVFMWRSRDLCGLFRNRPGVRKWMPGRWLFAGPLLEEDEAKRAADVFNAAVAENYPRYWKVVPVGYELQPGFEP